MRTIYASLALRPTRIGFLVRPTDLPAVRRIMRLCACLWGGVFNPIIPVSQGLPWAWRSRHGGRVTGAQLTAGYLRFFEPDVYVEASRGLATRAGITDLEIGIGERRVVPLDEFVSVESTGWPKMAFGLKILDLYEHLYHQEYRFVPRHEHRIAVFEGRSRDLAFVEAAFGSFPEDKNLSHIPRGFAEAFNPLRLEPNADNWLKVVQQNFLTPLHFTKHALETDFPSWSLGPTLFVVDPSSPLDLIDLWNLRQFRRNVLAVNLNWIPKIKGFLADFVAKNYRPLPGNPHGVMIDTTVQFARSIPEARTNSACNEAFADVPRGSWKRQLFYDAIWDEDRDGTSAWLQRADVSAGTTDLELGVTDEESGVRFQSLAPEFAERSEGNAASWVNVLQARDYGDLGLALVLPSYLQDPHRSSIRLGEPLILSREGFVLPLRFKGQGEYLQLPSGREAVVDWLKRRGIKASPSDPGRIADQLLASVRGFRGAHILADADTLHLLDKMAKSVRKGPGGTIEEYPERTMAVKEWTALLARRANRRELPGTKLDDFVRAGALRLGLSVRCPNCEERNWYGLSELNSRVTCARCLQQYDFPQGSLDFKQTPWHFRVAGPYSVPDFAGGGYATVLALRTFSRLLGTGHQPITYCTNLDLDIDGQPLEIDFALWYQSARMSNRKEEPVFVAGEAKSFAGNAIGSRDVNRLKRLAVKVPGAFLTFAVLKDNLARQEKETIAKLALWGRSPLRDGTHRAAVIVLTANELFAQHHVREAWKKLGGKHAEMVTPAGVWFDNLWTLADLTQQLYLGISSYSSWFREHVKHRKKQREQREARPASNRDP